MITDLISEDDYWSDIFDGITSEVIPLQYVDTVSIVFKNNKNVDIPVERLDLNWDKYHPIIMEYISNNSKRIKAVSYNVNLITVREEISNLTTKFFEKHKL